MNDFYAIEMAALEAEIQVAYDGLDGALEGVGAQYRDIISEYVEKLNDIDATIRYAIRQSDKDQFIEACKTGIDICKRFHDDMVNVPPDRFVKIKNLLPCFKVLANVASIAILMGGGKVIAKTPIIRQISAKLQTNNKVLGFIRDLFVFSNPVVSSVLGVKGPSPKIKDTDNRFVKTLKSNTSKVPAMLGSVKYAKSIVSTINETMTTSRYAKMISDADKETAGNRENKYNAVLGQIEEMISMYEDLIKNADNIIAATESADNAVEAFMSLESYWAPCAMSLGYDISEVKTAVEADIRASERWTPATELMVNTYYSCIERNQAILWDIIDGMWGAQENVDKASADKYARQGLRSCDRFIAEIKGLPETQDANVAALLNFFHFVEMTIIVTQFSFIIDIFVDAIQPDPFMVTNMIQQQVKTGQFTDPKALRAACYEIRDIMRKYRGFTEDVARYIKAWKFGKYIGKGIGAIFEASLDLVRLKAFKGTPEASDGSKYTYLQKLAIGEAERLRSFFTETLALKESDYIKPDADFASLDSYLMDTLHQSHTETIEHAMESVGAVDWMFG